MIDSITSVSSSSTTLPVVNAPASNARPAEQQKAAVKTAPQRPMTAEELHSIVKELNKTLETLSTKVTFSLDEKSHKPIIKIIDAQSKAVIFQMPPEGMLRAAQRMTHLLGLMVDQTE